MHTERKQNHSYEPLQFAIVVLLLISIFLPYVKTDTYGLKELFRRRNLPTFSIQDHGISQFTYAIAYVNAEQIGIGSDYAILGILFLTEWAGILLTLISLCFRKSNSAIVFSALSFFLNLALHWLFSTAGIVPADSSYSRFSIGFYLIFCGSLAEIVLSLIRLIYAKRKKAIA